MKTAHRCPVCNGQGLVQNGFYRAIGVDNYTTSDATPEQCRSCQGIGIVWCEDEQVFPLVIDGNNLIMADTGGG